MSNFLNQKFIFVLMIRTKTHLNSYFHIKKLIYLEEGLSIGTNCAQPIFQHFDLFVAIECAQMLQLGEQTIKNSHGDVQ